MQLMTTELDMNHVGDAHLHSEMENHNLCRWHHDSPAAADDVDEIVGWAESDGAMDELATTPPLVQHAERRHSLAWKRSNYAG